MEMVNCGICSDVISAMPDSIPCSNKTCKVVYHMRCAGLSRTKISMIAEMPNLHYYCNGCCKSLETGNSVAPEILAASDISNQLIDIKNCISMLTDAFRIVPEWPTISPLGKMTKRPRVVDDLETGAVPVDPISTIPRPNQKQNALVVGSAVESQGLLAVEPRKELVASMFDPSTESDQLADFLKAKLSIPVESSIIRVRKLVAADKDLSTLDYVSFKVSVTGAHFNDLMSPTMWPSGVRVREFQYRPRKSRPAAVFLPTKDGPTTEPLEQDPALIQM